jgi:hypothetical protein
MGGMDRVVFLPVQLTADDCMDAGGRATHGAVAEANMKMGTKQQRHAHFHMQLRGPEGLADAGVPFLDSSLGMQRRIKVMDATGRIKKSPPSGGLF